jgi:hypothetical protein
VFIPAIVPVFSKHTTLQPGRTRLGSIRLDPCRYQMDDDIGPSQNPVPPNNSSMSYSKGDEGARRGRARMREIASEDQVAIEHLTASLRAGVGRPPTAVKTIQAEALAVTMVRAGRLRASGRSDAGERARLAQVLDASSFGVNPAPAVI